MEDLLLPVVACWLIADFFSGFFHWLEQRYGILGIHPLLDRFVVEPNMRHHRFPGGMSKGSYLETNRISISGVVFVIAACVFLGVRRWEIFATLMFLSQSNQVHKWAHCGTRPLIVQILQSIGLFQSVSQHAQHHKKPYLVNYCVMSDWLNPTLNKLGFWAGLEKLLAAFGLKALRNL